MDKLLDLKDGPTGFLVSLCLILTFQLIFSVAKFVWSMREKRENASEKAIMELTDVVRKNTVATEKLDYRLSQVEIGLNSLKKFKLDLRRYYTALKMLSGDRWPSIRDEIMSDVDEELL